MSPGLITSLPPFWELRGYRKLPLVSSERERSIRHARACPKKIDQKALLVLLVSATTTTDAILGKSCTNEFEFKIN